MTTYADGTRSASLDPDVRRSEVRVGLSSSSWPAIAAGAFAGLGTAIVMGTLGTAIGITAGASVDAASASEVEDAAVGFGIGAGIWILLTAAVVGVVGGRVLARMVPGDRPYHPAASGVVTWALGLTIAVGLVAIGGSGLAAGLGSGVAGVAASNPGIRARVGEASFPAPSDTRPTEGVVGRTSAGLTDAERARVTEAAKDAAKAAATGAWFTLFAQIVGLAATILAARRGVAMVRGVRGPAI